MTIHWLRALTLAAFVATVVVLVTSRHRLGLRRRHGLHGDVGRGLEVAAVDDGGDLVRRVEDLVEAVQAEQEQPDPEQPQAPKAESPQQNRRPDGRTYEERTVEELRERAGELQIEGRSTMNKDELIAALRQHAR